MSVRRLSGSSPEMAMAGAIALGFCASPALGCTVTATSLDFGSINPLIAADTTSVATVTVSCTALTSYTIALSAGSAGSFLQRTMRSGANLLGYQIYSDAANSTVWGDGSGGSSLVNASAAGPGTTSYAYGRVPHQQTAVPGAYADSIVVTVTY
jgi:spore coat protein U-like protein